MTQLHLELDALEIESLDLVNKTEHNEEADLDSMMIGHGMLEIGASNNCSLCSGSSCCNGKKPN